MKDEKSESKLSEMFLADQKLKSKLESFAGPSFGYADSLLYTPLKTLTDTLNYANLTLVKSLEPANMALFQVTERLKIMQAPANELLKQIQEQTRPFQLALKQFEETQKHWSFATQSVLGGLSKTISEAFPPELFIKIRLQSQYWLITDQELMDQITEASPEYEEMGAVVVEYYRKENWTGLEKLVFAWRPHLSQERFEHFVAYLHLTKEIKTGESHKATVPAIIAQLDGLVRHLRTLLPSGTKDRIQQEIYESLPVELKGKRVDLRNEVTVQVIGEVVDFWSADMLQEIIFGGLFRNSKDIGTDDSYLLFRHKILHGDPDYLSYGTEENFVRLMLYADFLVHLIGSLSKGQSLNDPAPAEDNDHAIN